MINNIYLLLMVCFIIISGMLTARSDIKFGKIYNRQIIRLFITGLIVQVTWIAIFNRNIFFIYVLNLIIGTCLGYFLYYYNIWAAGDAKLYSLFLALVPVIIYPKEGLNIFPGFVILIMIFTIGFLYITLETLYLFVKEVKSGVSVDLMKSSFSKEALLKMLPIYSFSYIFALIYNDLLSRYVNAFYMSNQGVLKFLNFAIIFILLSKNLSKTFYLLGNLCGIIYLIIRFSIFNSGGRVAININIVALVTVVILVRYLAARYNYKKINCKELKPGDILSYRTILGFYNSRVKGLPMVTTESPHSRLNLEEVESILRWSKSKYGEDFVYVVRHIPFAPFIAMGSFFYVIYKVVILKF